MTELATITDDEQWRAGVSRLLDDHSAKIEALRGNDVEHATQLNSMQAELTENTTTTRRIDENTAGMVEMMQAWSGAMQVIQSVGRFFKPLSYVAVFASACAGAYAAFKSGITPK